MWRLKQKLCVVVSLERTCSSKPKSVVFLKRNTVVMNLNNPQKWSCVMSFPLTHVPERTVYSLGGLMVEWNMTTRDVFLSSSEGHSCVTLLIS